MSNISQTLFAGLGSPHGDDQIGWLVADRLGTHCGLSTDVAVRKAAIPLDLLDWMEGNDFLHVCDASQGIVPLGQFQRWEWDDTTEQTGPTRLRRLGSHDFGLPAVLDLAARLHRLPKRIIVWAIAGADFEPSRPVSAEVLRALPSFTASILEELNHARVVPCTVAAESG